MDEWFKSHAWKACLGLYLTGVRIPVFPPNAQHVAQRLKKRYSKTQTGATRFRRGFEHGIVRTEW